MIVLDYIYTAFLVVWSKYDSALLGGFLLAFVVSGIKTHMEGDFKFWEGLMCGIISAVVWISAAALGIPTGLTAVVSGMIGFYGSKATMDAVKQRVFGVQEIKVDTNDKEL